MVGELEFCKAAFASFYASPSSRAIAVPDCASREFGVGFQDKIDYRHKAFASNDAFRDFLARDAPFYVSYSTARYRLPDAKPMPKKVFLGQDVVFDLDRQYPEEHPATHSKVFCLKCLERAREDALRFLEEFLLSDYGFSRGEVACNFSGSKGFHFHVRSPAVQQLSPDARRQLCDYAMAFEVSSKTLLSRSAIEGKRVQHALRGPAAASRGWGAKVFREVFKFASNAGGEEFKEWGAQRKAARLFIENRQAALEKLSAGNWDFVAGLEDVWVKLIDSAVSRTRIELDKPVTFDKARLIRVPGSLHGDTGLCAKEIPLGELSSFRPDVDAVALRGAQEVVPGDSFNFEFNNVSFELQQGVAKELPLAVAVLLLRKGKASLAKQ
ncbi:MAG: DNA primase small subunit domain-containing protein [Candidatus Micrarchaeota archaeon]